MEYDNAKEALKNLIEFNDKELNPAPTIVYPNGPQRPASVNDIQDFNEEVLINIADLLGMSDLYLDNSVSK